MEPNTTNAFPSEKVQETLDDLDNFDTIGGEPVTKSFPEELENLFVKVEFILDYNFPTNSSSDRDRVNEYYKKYKDTYKGLTAERREKQLGHLYNTVRSWFVSNLAYNTSWLDNLSLKLLETFSQTLLEQLKSDRAKLAAFNTSRVAFTSIYRLACRIRDEAYKVNGGKKENGKVNEEVLIARQLEISLLRSFYLCEANLLTSNRKELDTIPEKKAQAYSQDELTRVINREKKLRDDILSYPIIRKRLFSFIEQVFASIESDIRTVELKNMKVENIYEQMGKMVGNYIPGASNLGKDGAAALINEVKKVDLFKPVITSFETMTTNIAEGKKFNAGDLSGAFGNFRDMMTKVEELAKNKEKEQEANANMAGTAKEFERQTGLTGSPMDYLKETLGQLETKVNEVEKKENAKPNPQNNNNNN